MDWRHASPRQLCTDHWAVQRQRDTERRLGRDNDNHPALCFINSHSQIHEKQRRTGTSTACRQRRVLNGVLKYLPSGLRHYEFAIKHQALFASRSAPLAQSGPPRVACVDVSCVLAERPGLQPLQLVATSFDPYLPRPNPQRPAWA